MGTTSAKLFATGQIDECAFFQRTGISDDLDLGMGRLESFAMAAGGAAAVVRALQLVEREIRLTMALLGVPSVDQLHPGLLERTQPTRPADVLSAFPFLEEGY